MTTKLTLTIEESVIEKAKRYAKKHQRSLSEVVQNSLIDLLNADVDQNEFSPQTKKLLSLLKGPSTNYTDEELDEYRREYLENKYL